MIDDLQIIEAAERADRIKAAVPAIQVSTDAIFMAIILGKRRPGRPSKLHPPRPPVEPPEWFTETLARLKGTGERLTVGRFLMRAGQLPATKSDADAVGRWLRASGRMPRKTGGKLVFRM